MYIFPGFTEICLKFKFLCSKTDFLKKKYPKFSYTQKKHVDKCCIYSSIRAILLKKKEK